MHQVLFHIPFPGLPNGIPIYGFGTMLLAAFVLCSYLTERRARRQGIPPQIVQDLAVWIFFGGIVGGRILYMIQYHVPVADFYKIWEGGLIFYGAALGGLLAGLVVYAVSLRPRGVDVLNLADVLAPAIAVGLCLGRIGCLLNGCCYGNVACPHCAAIHFPLPSPPRYQLVGTGYQTAAGFLLGRGPDLELAVESVEPGSPAASSGLRSGDVIVLADAVPMQRYRDLESYLTIGWPRGKNDLSLTVRRGTETIDLPPFVPRTIGLHPTQVYESISMVLLFLVMTAFFPLRTRYGQVIVLFMLGYSVHRFLNEMLRNDTPAVAFGLKLSQNGSVILFAAALLLGLWIHLRGQRPSAGAPEPATVAEPGSR